jgi:hypothetical protein
VIGHKTAPNGGETLRGAKDETSELTATVGEASPHVNFPPVPGGFPTLKLDRGEYPPDAPRRGAPGGLGPSCLQVTTPPEEEQKLAGKLALLSGSARRSAYALQEDAKAAVERWGVKNTLFILLTFGGGKLGPTVKFAEERFDSFLTHELGKRFGGGIKVLERGEKHGRVHFHLLVDAGQDVSSGTNWEEVEAKNYQSLNAACKEAMGFVASKRRKYGFGRIGNVLPVKSTGEAVARYVSTYIAKHIGQRREDDKGARFRSYWGTARLHRKCTLAFSWSGVGGFLWRRKLAGLSALNGVRSSEDWARIFGPRWAYHISKYVKCFPLNYWPTPKHLRADETGIEEKFVDVPWRYKGEVVPSLFHRHFEFDDARDIRCDRVFVDRVEMIFGKALWWRDSEMLEVPTWARGLVSQASANAPVDVTRIVDGVITRWVPGEEREAWLPTEHDSHVKLYLRCGHG